MPLFKGDDLKRAEAVCALSYCNPFTEQRIAHERDILGGQFVKTDTSWHKRANEGRERANIDLLRDAAKELADTAREAQAGKPAASDADACLYENVVLYYLYNTYERDLLAHAIEDGAGTSLHPTTLRCYDKFLKDLEHYFGVSEACCPHIDDAPHLFALFFQLRRAFYHIFENIIGGSRAASRLRAAVWESIFTCDMARYRRCLYGRMSDITTLITGPSGTGKELVARAVGLSGYAPFDPATRRFVDTPTVCFHAVNLTALSPTLIESELFGHSRGAFTGAARDHAGRFENCPPFGAVFLDEIGELDAGIQVKLLRVLQNRTFQRIGDGLERNFTGKVISATNRDLAQEVRDGRFREDVYYRLCADVIVTPSLREQLEDSTQQLENLLLFISNRVAGADEGPKLASEVSTWIGEHLDPDYAWPGNVRELEQCVRNFLIRRSYTPSHAGATGAAQQFQHAVGEAALSAEELLCGYCTLVYARTGSYQETAKRLGLDRRTVKSKIQQEMLDALRGGA